VVDVAVKRRSPPAPEPLPVRASEGRGWIVGCQKCDRSHVIGRAAVMSGQWLPVHDAPKGWRPAHEHD
jgi:hypothetical protein